MNVHISIPYHLDKNLGLAYNQAMERIPAEHAACFIDYDVQLLTPDAPALINTYHLMNPDAVLTCFTNRVSPLSKMQLLAGSLSNDSDIRMHIRLAELQKQYLWSTTPILGDISGMLMVIPKKIWQKREFDQTGKCLGVDTHYARKLHKAGIPILRMDGVYCFHQYRMLQGITDKSHLL